MADALLHGARLRGGHRAHGLAVGLHWGWNLSGSLFDLAVDTQLLAPHARPLLSAGTALLLCACVWLLPRKSAERAAELAA